MDLSMEQKIDKALSKIESHESVCAVRYENIEKTLEERKGRLEKLDDRLEKLDDKIGGLYKTVITCAFAPSLFVIAIIKLL